MEILRPIRPVVKSGFFGLGLEHADQLGGRRVEHLHEAGRRGVEHAQQFATQHLKAGQIGQGEEFA